ncbi:tRNA lysidine(34) synthetase TilS [Fulvimarina sp. 2208YS6-2-32]|uniref:tRNA(Ile)-lysidine synthase n=1 Tax=Fulvimarina uroteuthidis TaxID=3098149 RepID=A0ABU5I7R2_9HYPH|nr:tRNA lysidine(34) synthetase TilS [Fulvimarina sp. 2208YS6-2-32]MDY8110973.1 tRNA lysidine(34) synthetase TilS [Fulvimarina sp. 2208YS6-2-32]
MLQTPAVAPTITAFCAGDLEDRLQAACPKIRFADVRHGSESRLRLLCAVSGGADSLALLCLASLLPRERFHVLAATVDHGLRPESAREAAYVARICRQFDVPHRVLEWRGWDGRGNLQAKARTARYALLTRCARIDGAGLILTAHHARDQLETILHAHERGDAPSRLAGMRPVRALDPWTDLLRPFLGDEPARLHAVLASHGIEAVRDPTNEDAVFARVRHRRAIAGMNEMAVGALRALQREAERARTRTDAALGAFVDGLLAAKRLCFRDDGTITLDAAAFQNGDAPLRERLLSRMLTAAGGAAHPPRRDRVARLADDLPSACRGPDRTLSGARIARIGSTIEISREYGRAGPAAIAEPWTRRHIVFDNRFDLFLTDAERALARGGGAVLAGFGATARGGAKARTLPCLIAEDGRVLVAHPGLLRADRPVGGPAAFSRIECRVRWRCLADLRDLSVGPSGTADGRVKDAKTFSSPGRLPRLGDHATKAP